MVDRALMVLYDDAKSGKLAWVETQNDFSRAFHRDLKSAIAQRMGHRGATQARGAGRT